MKHTPETWYIKPPKDAEELAGLKFTICHDDQWGSVYVATVSVVNTTPEATRSNAERIVACVNACAGIANPVERGVEA